MSDITYYLRFAKRQLGNALHLLLNRPFYPNPFAGATLDVDDLEIAAGLLKDKRQWNRLEAIEQYHHEFAMFNGSQYAYSFLGGRIALSAAIYALGLKAGDEVIIPGYTCVLVPNAFVFAGITPVFADIELDTYGLDGTCIEEHITEKTRAVLLQHLYGLVSRDSEEIIEIAKRNGLYVIEDCAQCTGAKYRGKKVGNLGDIAFYSSEHSKVFNTIVGGVVSTNNETIARLLKEYHESTPFPDEEYTEKQLQNVFLDYYQGKLAGNILMQEFAEFKYGKYRIVNMSEEELRYTMPMNYRRKMPPEIAAVGVNQLRKIESYAEERRVMAKGWDQWCEINRYKKPVVIDASVPVYLRYPVLVEPEKKRNLSWAIRELGILPGVWFKTNIHPTEYRVDNCPNAQIAVKRCINLPTLLHDGLSR